MTTCEDFYMCRLKLNYHKKIVAIIAKCKYNMKVLFEASVASRLFNRFIYQKRYDAPVYMTFISESGFPVTS